MTTNAELLDSLEKVGKRFGVLTKKVGTLNDELAALSDYALRSRRFIRLLVVSLILDVGLTLGLGVTAVNTRNAAIEARAATTVSKVNQNNVKVICEAGNENNAVNHQLWSFVLALPPTGPQTEQTKKQRVEFIAFINKAFSQRDCADDKRR